MNKNYIGVVVKDRNGNLSYQREPISRDYEDLKARLGVMCKNSNRTLLDLQDEMCRVFNLNELNRYYGYCLPYNYSESYIGGVNLLYKYEEYQNKIEEKKRELEKTLQFKIRLVNNISYTKEQWIEKEIKEYAKELKSEYCKACLRFIDAYNFYKTKELVKGRENTVMFSTEDIGWTTYEYPVNKDVVIKVHTNFGYGYVSYFFLNMKYKGVEILPYTAYIYYYNADAVQIMRHTRQYSTYDRDSWNLALNFAVEAANLAKDNPSEFINKWVINEIQEMYSGLVNYMNNPDAELEKFVQRGLYQIKFENGLWNMSTNVFLGNDEVNYKLYKNEMSTVFKAEKITGALSFLENFNLYFERFMIIFELDCLIVFIKLFINKFYIIILKYLIKHSTLFGIILFY
jgi:hypothetical protein